MNSTEQVTVPAQPVAPTVSPVTPPPAAPSRPRTWLRHIVGGGQIIETCPTFRDGTTWCQSSHANDDMGNLDDLVHGTDYVHTKLSVFDAEEGTSPWPVLSARIAVDPYSENPARNTPHVTFEPWQDEVMECLSPDEFAAVIAQIRAHCDRLDEVHARLVAARAEHGER